MLKYPIYLCLPLSTPVPPVHPFSIYPHLGCCRKSSTPAPRVAGEGEAGQRFVVLARPQE